MDLPDLSATGASSWEVVLGLEGDLGFESGWVAVFGGVMRAKLTPKWLGQMREKRSLLRMAILTSFQRGFCKFTTATTALS